MASGHAFNNPLIDAVVFETAIERISSIAPSLWITFRLG
jgi:hypothetical protein